MNEDKKARTQEILLLLKAFDGECKSAIEKIETTYRDELVEEKKTLSDKIIEPCSLGMSNNIKVTDVKEAIKEFLDWNIQQAKDYSGEKSQKIVNKAKEIFGERLLK